MSGKRKRFALRCWLLLAAFMAVEAATALGVAVINDGDTRGDFAMLQGTFVNELQALAGNEFDLQIQSFGGGWSAAGIQAALDRAYRDPAVDMVLVLGIAANQLLVSRSTFAKPTFLPIVFDRQLTGAPREGDHSGVANLNYLTDPIEFEEDIQLLRRVYPFKHAVLLVDEIFLQILAVEQIVRSVEASGLTLTLVAHNGQDHDINARIPAGADAIVVTGLPRMPPVSFDAMIESFITRRLPAFSLVGGQSSVTRGFLASDAVDQDWTRLARRNALNMQAVMLGAEAASLPVVFKGKRELAINMQTARRIGLSPRFDVLSEAVLIDTDEQPAGPSYNLVNVAQVAVRRNLDLAAQTLALAASGQDVASARSDLLPQGQLGTSFTRRKVSPLVESGQLAERSLDGSLTLSQLIFADAVWANNSIARYLHLSQEQALEQVRLDIVRAATTAFLNVLRAQTQLRVQQDNLKVTRANLDLARDRVAVGSATASDVYRWDTRMASARSDVLAARANLEQSREALNRLLHRPLTELFQLEIPALDTPFAFSRQQYDQLIDNPRRWRQFVEYQAQAGLQRSPELAEIDALIKAKQRETVNLKRSFWLPDFSLQGQYSDNFGQSGAGVGPFENRSDWNLMVVGSLPLFDGGRRRSGLAKAGLELQQLQVARASVRGKVDQNIRASMHRAQASFATIELAEQAATAARLSLNLVTEAYASGVESIVNLLDAQNSVLQADEAAANSVYNFLLDVMDGQRAAGQFDFLLTAEQQSALVQRVSAYMAKQENLR